MAVCRLPPKGWACKRPGGHEGSCPAYPTNVALKFLRRNDNGKLERLVSNGVWTGWISAEYPSRYWYMFKAIAKARGI